jgi:protein-ribulosamine 3-kinase
MMKMPDAPIKDFFQKKLSIPPSALELVPEGGGSINDTYRVRVARRNYFLKLNSRQQFPSLFEKEKNGLQFLAQQNIFKTPEVIFCETSGAYQYLLLEWIPAGEKDTRFWKTFGEKLAALHSITDNDFGFFEDNYMGALRQINKRTEYWTDFFIYYRLKPQLQLAAQNQAISSKLIAAFEKLYRKLPDLFPPEKPSLLHGDLWSGNYLCDECSQPVLIDPAVYFGHRSMDLAMTTLFGGFDKSFYDAYHYHYPLASNHREQWEICNLYPLLIHLNLFGATYLAAIERTLRKFL